MRIEHIGDATLYLGDCLEVLPTIGKVDAVVTDPPYGIGFKYASHDDTPENYGKWIWSVIEKAESLCSDGSPIFVFQAMLNCTNFHEWFPRKWRILAAAKNFVQMRKIAMQYSFDPVLVWWTDGESQWSQGNANRDFFIANTAPVVSDPSNLQREHPCPRPLDQMEHIISQWVRPNSLCIDPFMGSGTTGVACANLGRKFIGIEIEKKYFDIACKRIEIAYQQPRLFDEPRPQAKPQELGI